MEKKFQKRLNNSRMAVRVPDEVRLRFEAIAQKTGGGLSDVVRSVLIEACERIDDNGVFFEPAPLDRARFVGAMERALREVLTEEIGSGAPAKESSARSRARVVAEVPQPLKQLKAG